MASKKIDFEESLKELSKIVELLESGECTLDESIALFEKGMKISKDCSQTLENARQKIVALTDAEGMSENNG